MIISQYDIPKVNKEIDHMIRDIVKNQIQKVMQDTVNDLEQVAKRLRRIIKVNKEAMIDRPELYQQIKKQIVEIEGISENIKKEVKE